MQTTALTTREAARALGVSEASLKRWCDQGLLPAARTPGGHRRVSIGALAQFIRAREFDVVQPQVFGVPRLVRAPRDSGDALTAALQAALEQADEDEVRSLVLGQYLAGRSAAEILDECVAPAFHGLGERWAHGQLAVYEERRAVELLTALLHQWRLLLPATPPRAPLAIGGTLAGDPYALPTIMVEIALCEAGWCARSYGCGHPADTLLTALRTIRPRLFWLSINAVPSEAQLVTDVQALYELAESLGVAMLVGGRLVNPELRARIRYSAFCDDLRHAVDFARALYSPGSPRAFDGGQSA